jgi:hypothetical protein
VRRLRAERYTPLSGGSGHHARRHYDRCVGCCHWTGTGDTGQHPVKPRPRKPGLDLSLWDRRPSGWSREWNVDKSARAAMCASPHPEKMRYVRPGLSAFCFPFPFFERSDGKQGKRCGGITARCSRSGHGAGTSRAAGRGFAPAMRSLACSAICWSGRTKSNSRRGRRCSRQRRAISVRRSWRRGRRCRGGWWGDYPPLEEEGRAPQVRGVGR